MDCEWELREKGDDRYVVSALPPDAADIIARAAESEPHLALHFSPRARSRGVLRWARGVRPEDVRAAIDAAVEPTRDAARRATSLPIPGAAPVAAAPDRVYASQALTIAALSMHERGPADPFDSFAETRRQRARGQFVRWVEATPELHGTLLAAINASLNVSAGHAVDRAWERLSRGPVELGRCLDARYKIMEIVRLRIEVHGAGTADLTLDGAAFLSASEPSTSAWRREAVEVGLSAEDASRAIRAIEDATRRVDSTDVAEDADGDEELGVPLALTQARALTTGLRARAARVFRVTTLKVVTTIGMLVFSATGSRLITFLSDDGRCHAYLTEALRRRRDATRHSWQRMVRAPLVLRVLVHA